MRDHFNYPQLSGIIYGRADELEQTYYLNTNKQIYIHLAFNGRVSRVEKVGNDGSSRSALGRAYVTYDGGTAASTDRMINELNAYHNHKTGRSLPDDFEMQTVTDQFNHQQLIFRKREKPANP